VPFNCGRGAADQVTSRRLVYCSVRLNNADL
jgi:hypothetical protein